MEKKKKISFTKTKIIVCVLCFVIGIGVIAYSIGLKNYNESREDERVYLTATVVEVDRDTHRRNGKTVTETTVFVSYVVDGEVVVDTLSNSGGVKEGEEIQVYYYPERPTEIYSVKGDKSTQTMMIGIGCVLILVAFGALFGKEVKRTEKRVILGRTVNIPVDEDKTDDNATFVDKDNLNY